MTDLPPPPPDLQARVEALEAQVAYLAQRIGLIGPGTMTTTSAADAEIVALVRAGDKIHAIKRHREVYGTSLRDAKHAIDALALG